jgi:hypothetical protein
MYRLETLSWQLFLRFFLLNARLPETGARRRHYMITVPRRLQAIARSGTFFPTGKYWIGCASELRPPYLDGKHRNLHGYRRQSHLRNDLCGPRRFHSARAMCSGASMAKAHTSRAYTGATSASQSSAIFVAKYATHY